MCKFAEQSYAQYDFRMHKGSNSGLYIKANSPQRESQKKFIMFMLLFSFLFIEIFVYFWDNTRG